MGSHNVQTYPIVVMELLELAHRPFLTTGTDSG